MLSTDPKRIYRKKSTLSIIREMQDIYDAMGKLSIYDQFILLKEAEAKIAKH
jgi:hypothetical protein